MDAAKTATVTFANLAGFYSVSPRRLIDTREASGPLGGPALQAGATRAFTLVGACGVPVTAKALSVNTTITAPTGPGYLTLFPTGTPLPLVSTVRCVIR